MAIYNTSDTIDTSIYLKAKLEKNMVGSNYYIENLQFRRDRDWYYRYNVVDIEEEREKQIEYTKEVPCYTHVEATITNVKSDKGEDLGTDWAHLAFRKLNHPCDAGYRYRYSLDFPKMKDMTEEEKHYSTSIWLAINKTPITGGNAVTVRRCNSAITMVGSPTGKFEDATEIHTEPCIIENELKYMQIYYNYSVPVPQAEWYIIMQLNYFTNFITINDRFLFGTMNPLMRDNNSVCKVKAVFKAETKHTFVKDIKDEMLNTGIVIIALDRDMLSPDDDLETRVAKDCTVYNTEEHKQHDPVEHYLYIEEPFCDRILAKDECSYTVNLYQDGQPVDGAILNYSTSLTNVDEANWSKYFVFTQIDNNNFTIKNLKQCNNGKLIVKITTPNPVDSTDVIIKEQEIELGGFY